jgi:hypothetical protein
MKKDLIERIRFIDSMGNIDGEVLFDYLSSDTVSDDGFAVPQLPSGTGSPKTERLHWLSALAANNL